MKISNLLYMGALSTLALVSCTNNDDNSEWYGSEGIVFTTAIQSRVSGNTWNANDEVGIYMMNAGGTIDAATAQNKKYIAQTNGTLTAASGNGIYLPESGSVDFIAYYPYTTSVSGNKIAVNVPLPKLNSPSVLIPFMSIVSPFKVSIVASFDTLMVIFDNL